MNKEKLCGFGVDVDSAMERLGGNEVLFECLLREFLVDPNYGELLKALEVQDADRAFAAAHTLKGVCISLSLNRLYGPVSEMTECLRAKDLLSARAQLMNVMQAYEQLTENLRKYFAHE